MVVSSTSVLCAECVKPKHHIKPSSIWRPIAPLQPIMFTAQNKTPPRLSQGRWVCQTDRLRSGGAALHSSRLHSVIEASSLLDTRRRTKAGLAHCAAHVLTCQCGSCLLLRPGAIKHAQHGCQVFNLFCDCQAQPIAFLSQPGSGAVCP